MNIVPKNVSGSKKPKNRKKAELSKKTKKPSDHINETKRKERKKKRKKRYLIKKRAKKEARRQLIVELSLSLATLLLFFLLLQSVLFSMPKMVGYSMVPQIGDGDLLFVNRLETVKRFSLIYYQEPKTKEKSIRRVIGLPNERVKYQEDQLFINDSEIPERFLEKQVFQAKTNGTVFTENFYLEQFTKDTVIPKDSYFVLGDNRPFATDSRTFGYVKKADIIGIVEMRLLPIR